MNKPSPATEPLQPGQVCGFFDQNRFQLGLISSVLDNHCEVSTAAANLLRLYVERLVLCSEQVYPIDNPASVLTEFSAEMEHCKAGTDLSSIRSTMLSQSNDLSLPDLIALCNLDKTDACRFALYLLLRDHPALFRLKKGICHANSIAEEEEYHQQQEALARHREELAACPLLAKKGLPVLFSASLLKAAEQLPEYESDPTRTDLTGLDCWTIDAPTSHDMDDALSLIKTETGWELGIHITDVTHYIKPGSELDTEARIRTSSIYLPERDIHMLPESISCAKASLLQGSLRPAVSLLCQINSEGDIVSQKVLLSQIRIHRNFSYDECTEFLSGTPIHDYKTMSDRVLLLQTITDRHRALRQQQGALLIETELTPARRLVAECMVIYNAVLTEIMAAIRAPLFYRYLNEEMADADSNPERGNRVPPAVLGTLPKPHAAMGLKAYAQMSSPLRRYSDLVNQRQAIAVLNSTEPPYAETDLQAMLEHISQTRQRIRQVTQQAESRQNS